MNALKMAAQSANVPKVKPSIKLTMPPLPNPNRIKRDFGNGIKAMTSFKPGGYKQASFLGAVKNVGLKAIGHGGNVSIGQKGLVGSAKAPLKSMGKRISNFSASSKLGDTISSKLRNAGNVLSGRGQDVALKGISDRKKMLSNKASESFNNKNTLSEAKRNLSDKASKAFNKNKKNKPFDLNAPTPGELAAKAQTTGFLSKRRKNTLANAPSPGEVARSNRMKGVGSAANASTQSMGDIAREARLSTPTRAKSPKLPKPPTLVKPPTPPKPEVLDHRLG